MKTLNVLFIDDSQEDIELIILELQKQYNVVWKRVERETDLLVALNEHWDVVLCDYELSSFTPYNALDIVKNAEIQRGVGRLPLIIVSGAVKIKDILELLNLGVRDFINKNTLERLYLAIQRELRNEIELKRARMIVQDSFNATIQAWSWAMEIRDMETKGHGDRVTALTIRLAISMEVSHLDLPFIQHGALLHDIGKMGIPDVILFKQDELLDDEWAIMRMHPVYAYNMLKNIPYLKQSLDIPHYHHERLNGTGYPDHLSGDDIPFYARLFSVVDVYDALTSNRSYRPSWDKSRAIAYILEERGITLDAKVVDEFVNMIGRG